MQNRHYNHLYGPDFLRNTCAFCGKEAPNSSNLFSGWLFKIESPLFFGNCASTEYFLEWFGANTAGGCICERHHRKMPETKQRWTTQTDIGVSKQTNSCKKSKFKQKGETFDKQRTEQIKTFIFLKKKILIIL